MSTEPRKVRLVDVRRPDMTLVMSDASGGEVEYTVRGQLTVDEVIEMYEIQTAMGASQETDDALPMLRAISGGQKFLTRLVRERYPDAPEVVLGMEAMMAGFVAMMQGVTAADAIAETLTAGLTDEFIQEVAAETAGSDEEVAAIAADPTTASPQLSSTPSSDSPSITTGIPNGGAPAPGAPSDSTPSEPISA